MSTNTSKTPFCTICFNAGKNKSEYTNHWVRETPGGKVCCPTLLNHKCEYCKKLGHMLSHCRNLKRSNAAKTAKDAGKMFCHVCFQDGKPETDYTSHWVKEAVGGKICCPTLLNHECRYCKKKGHRISHCPKLKRRKARLEANKAKNKPSPKVTLGTFITNVRKKMIQKDNNVNNFNNNTFHTLMEHNTDGGREPAENIHNNSSGPKTVIPSSPKSVWKKHDQTPGKTVIVRKKRPINMWTALKSLFKKSRSESYFVRRMHQIQEHTRMPLPDVVLHALHIISEKDDLRLIEKIVQDVGTDVIQAVVNRPFGRHGYCPLCRAGYAGALGMVRYLVSQGADPLFVNEHGEDILSCIHQGLADITKKRPQDEIFLKERYTECLRFIEKFWEVERERKRRQTAPALKAYVPKSILRRRAVSTLERFWSAKTRNIKPRPTPSTDIPTTENTSKWGDEIYDNDNTGDLNTAC